MKNESNPETMKTASKLHAELKESAPKNLTGAKFIAYCMEAYHAQFAPLIKAVSLTDEAIEKECFKYLNSVCDVAFSHEKKDFAIHMVKWALKRNVISIQRDKAISRASNNNFKT